MKKKKKGLSRKRSPKAVIRRRTALKKIRTVSSFGDFLWSGSRGEQISDSAFKALQDFLALKGEARVAEARKIIEESIIEAQKQPDTRLPFAFNESQELLPGYATLDDPHRSEIKRLINDISGYLADGSRKRPLNCLMLAAPGAGKSHFIKQLAIKMKPQRVRAVMFNMATMQSHDDMAQPVDELRNVKVNDHFPLLFLDEFDSDPARYATLLPLLWDGELHLGHRDLKLGKAVIVLAGSNPDLPKLMDQSAKMQIEGDVARDGLKSMGKLIDLLSRINGGIINIPDLDLRSDHRDRRIDKVCAAIELLKGRFGDDLIELPRMLLRFIAHTKFRYGVRSIAHLIDIIDSKALREKSLKLSLLNLPLKSEESLQESSLKLHLLDQDQAFGVVSRWKDLAKDKTVVDLRRKSIFPTGESSFRILSL